jgi:GntR family transcriptional regulator/MocR family aminotransferase
VKSLARSQLPSWTPDFETGDVPELIEQIRTRLLPQRGVFALPDEILVTVGTQHAYYLLAEVLFDETTRVGLEEPGHPHARNSFALRRPSSSSCRSMPKASSSTPCRRSTTSSSRPRTRARRRRRCRSSAGSGCSAAPSSPTSSSSRTTTKPENLYAGAPMPALKSLDRSGRVVYVGSVSKSLSPALRLGYVVASRELIAELRALRHAMVRHPSTFLQHAYALFLSLGHHASHARRVNRAMRERLDAAAAALRAELPAFEFAMPQGGASLWVRAPAWVDAGELATIAGAHGVLIEAGGAFFARPPYPCPHFRLACRRSASSASAPACAPSPPPTTSSRRRAANVPARVRTERSRCALAPDEGKPPRAGSMGFRSLALLATRRSRHSRRIDTFRALSRRPPMTIATPGRRAVLALGTSLALLAPAPRSRRPRR